MSGTNVNSLEFLPFYHLDCFYKYLLERLAFPLWCGVTQYGITVVVVTQCAYNKYSTRNGISTTVLTNGTMSTILLLQHTTKLVGIFTYGIVVWSKNSSFLNKWWGYFHFKIWLSFFLYAIKMKFWCFSVS